MTANVTTAIVLSAGLGTRMRPLTDAKPKPLVEVGGKALIDHALDRLAQAGIVTAVVNVHYMADQIEAHVATRRRPRIVISDERNMLLETGGGVRKALPLLGPGPFLVHNSDALWVEGIGSNLERLMAAWNDASMDALLLLAATLDTVGYPGAGDFTMDAAGRLARRTSGQIAPFVFTGVSIAHPRLLAETPDGPFSLNLAWDRPIARGRLHGVRAEGIFMHVGTPEAIAAAERTMAGDEPGTAVC